MNFDLDDNQTLFRDTVARFSGSFDIVKRRTIRQKSGGIDRARWSELAALGLIALAASDADGGLGGSMIDCIVVAQALGHALAIDPWLECGFMPARLLRGTTDIPSVLDGQTLVAVAHAEPGRGYSLTPKATTLQDGRLTGAKSFVLGGAAADLFIVSAADRGQTRLFAVTRDAPGVTIQPYPVVDGGMAAQVRFDHAACTQLSAAFDSEIINSARLVAAAEMTGIAQRLFEDTLAYVKTREQFGQPLGRFQVIQHRMVDVYAQLESIQSALYRAVLDPDTRIETTKAFVAEGAIAIAEQAVQLHGGMGMTDELAIGHGLKRIQLLARLFGDSTQAYAQHGEAA